METLSPRPPGLPAIPWAQTPRKVCIVQRDAIGVLDPSSRRPFGGAEVRAVTFARLLRDTGRFELTLVVHEQGATDNAVMEGIRIRLLPTHDYRHTRLDRRLLEFYEELDADAFLAFGAHELSHEVVRYGALLGVPVVVGAAADASFAASVFKNSPIRNEYDAPCLHVWYAMANASHVLVQSEYQLGELLRRWGQRGTLIPNPVPWGWEPAPLEPGRSGGYLWVGRAQSDKDPWKLLDAAEIAADSRFTMILDGGVGSLDRRSRRRIPPNVKVRDRVDMVAMRRLMIDCDAVVNTSPREGFPNLFLQAAVVGKPSLSLCVDPDGWASRRGCGTTSNGDLSHFAKMLERGTKDRPWLESMGAVARTDALERHGHDSVREALLRVLDREMASAPVAARPRVAATTNASPDAMSDTREWSPRQTLRQWRRHVSDRSATILRVDLPFRMLGLADRLLLCLGLQPSRNPFDVRASNPSEN